MSFCFIFVAIFCLARAHNTNHKDVIKSIKVATDYEMKRGHRNKFPVFKINGSEDRRFVLKYSCT